VYEQILPCLTASRCQNTVTGLSENYVDVSKQAAAKVRSTKQENGTFTDNTSVQTQI
jgi:hypothetical protein